MKTLYNNETIYFNDKEYTVFKENILNGRLSNERNNELKGVSERFKNATKVHGKAMFKTCHNGLK